MESVGHSEVSNSEAHAFKAWGTLLAVLTSTAVDAIGGSGDDTVPVAAVRPALVTSVLPTEIAALPRRPAAFALLSACLLTCTGPSGRAHDARRACR